MPEPDESGAETQTPDPSQTEETTPESGGDASLEDELAALDDDRVDSMAAEGEGPSPGEAEAGAEETSEEGPSPGEGAEETTAEAEEGVTPEHVRWNAEGDPEGTYRDANGALHDAETHEFREGEKVEPPEHIKEVAEADISPEEADEFFEGEGEPDIEPIEFEHDGETLELAVEDEEARDVLEERLETAEQVDDLSEERARVQEAREEIEAAEQEIALVEEGIRTDPSGFILDHLDPSPETVQSLARDLLAFSDEAFEEVANVVQQWRRDGTARKEYRLDRKEELQESRQEREQATRQRVTVRRIGRRIRQDFIPADADTETARQIFDDIVREVERYAESEETLPAVDSLEEIPGVERRLELYGIDPDSVSANGRGASQNGRGETSDVAQATPAGEQEEELTERAERARRIGVALRKRRERKEDAASTAPAGAGATPSGIDTSGDNLEEALEKLEQRMG